MIILPVKNAYDLFAALDVFYEGISHGIFTKKKKKMVFQITEALKGQRI